MSPVVSEHVEGEEGAFTLVKWEPSLTSGTEGKDRLGFISRAPVFMLYRLLITISRSEVVFTGKKRRRGTLIPGGSRNLSSSSTKDCGGSKNLHIVINKEIVEDPKSSHCTGNQHKIVEDPETYTYKKKNLILKFLKLWLWILSCIHVISFPLNTKLNDDSSESRL